MKPNSARSGVLPVLTLSLSLCAGACGSDTADADDAARAGASSGGASTAGVATAGGSYSAGVSGSPTPRGGSAGVTPPVVERTSGGAGSPASAGAPRAAGSSGALSGAGGSTSGSAGLGGAQGGGSGDSGGASVGGSAGGVGGVAGSAGSAGTVSVRPPVSDKSSPIKIATPGTGYVVEGNIPYGPLSRQRLDVIYPGGGRGGPRGTEILPAVIMFHGGGWIQGDKATMASFYNRFLAHGFIVCTAEYRVADGTSDGGIAPAAVQDALLAAKWFWDHMDYYRADKARYVVTGGSAGGHLALMVGMATPAAELGPTSPTDFKIAAIVNGYGPADVSDLLARGTSFAVQWLPAGTPGRTELARRLSPVTYVRKDMPPLITVHGSADSTIPVAQSRTLDGLLQAAGADAVLRIVQGAGHGFTTPAAAWPDAESAIFGFLVARGIGK